MGLVWSGGWCASLGSDFAALLRATCSTACQLCMHAGSWDGACLRGESRCLPGRPAAGRRSCRAGGQAPRIWRPWWAAACWASAHARAAGARGRAPSCAGRQVGGGAGDAITLCFLGPRQVKQATFRRAASFGAAHGSMHASGALHESSGAAWLRGVPEDLLGGSLAEHSRGTEDDHRGPCVHGLLGQPRTQVPVLREKRVLHHHRTSHRSIRYLSQPVTDYRTPCKERRPSHQIPAAAPRTCCSQPGGGASVLTTAPTSSTISKPTLRYCCSTTGRNWVRYSRAPSHLQVRARVCTLGGATAPCSTCATHHAQRRPHPEPCRCSGPANQAASSRLGRGYLVPTSHASSDAVPRMRCPTCSTPIMQCPSLQYPPGYDIHVGQGGAHADELQPLHQSVLVCFSVAGGSRIPGRQAGGGQHLAAARGGAPSGHEPAARCS